MILKYWKMKMDYMYYFSTWMSLKHVKLRSVCISELAD